MTERKSLPKPYYDEDGITLYCGDCREFIPSLGRVDAVVTDPPYALPTSIASGRTNISNLGDLSIVEYYFRGLIDELWQNVGDAGQMFLFCDGTFYPVLFRASYGKPSQALLVWDKGQIGMGREFRKSHELILRLWGNKTPTFSDGVGRSDVLRCSPIPTSKRVHPAEKPTSLIAELLRVCGPVILDPFCGSGSTLVAAKKNGKTAIGIELNEKYCEIAAKRLAQQGPHNITS